MRAVVVLSVSAVGLTLLAGFSTAGRIHVRSSVMNDGNYSLVEYRDTLTAGPIERIEVYRCSQPAGTFGVTAAGTTVGSLCGVDHGTGSSNRVFRNVFSRGSGPFTLPVTLEIREEFDVGSLGVGSWEHRIRDVDAASASYGRILRILAAPSGTAGEYDLTYEIRGTGVAPAVAITSPLPSPVPGINPSLLDLGAPVGSLPPIDGGLPGNPLTVTVSRYDARSTIVGMFSTFAANFSGAPLSKWGENIYDYLSFGDVGLKSTHPGTNLVGPAESVRLISELLVFRAYRADMILLGIAAGVDLGQGQPTCGPLLPGDNDTKGNIYHLFVSGFINGIGLHRLIVDKIHSDYGGVPMALAPGSKLEICAFPVADATRANQAVAELADALYLFPDSLVAVGIGATEGSFPSTVEIRAARPNPSGRGATFTVVLPRAGHVELRVHAASGRIVRSIDRGRVDRGPHTVSWDGRDRENRELPSGVYFVELIVDGRPVAARKSVQVR